LAAIVGHALLPAGWSVLAAGVAGGVIAFVLAGRNRADAGAETGTR
jgi:hypothetical protein